MKLLVGVSLAVVAVLVLVLVLVETQWSPRPANPLEDPAVVAVREDLRGHVRTRLPAGGYVYLEVEDATGALRWLVTLDGPASHAADVTATSYARVEQFHSPRLGRDFAPLRFASVSALNR